MRRNFSACGNRAFVLEVCVGSVLLFFKHLQFSSKCASYETLVYVLFSVEEACRNS